MIPTPPYPKPKLTAEERRARQADHLMVIRFRMMIGHEREERGITAPSTIAAALGMEPVEATALLQRKQWREGDVMLLEAVTARLGMRVSGLDPWRP